MTVYNPYFQALRESAKTYLRKLCLYVLLNLEKEKLGKTSF
jgi:hypothetical protein